MPKLFMYLQYQYTRMQTAEAVYVSTVPVHTNADCWSCLCIYSTSTHECRLLKLFMYLQYQHTRM